MADQIFDELDKANKPKFSCGCGTMLTLLVGFLAAGAAAALVAVGLVKSKVLKSDFSSAAVSREQVAAKLSFAKQLILTEDELTGLIAVPAANNPKFPVKGAAAQVTPSGIIVTGTVVKPLKSDVAVTVLPHIEQGKLVYKVVKITAGRLTLPEIAVEAFSQSIVQWLSELVPLASTTQLNAVELNQGYLIVR